MNEHELLRVEGISKSFPGVKALDDINFNLYKGEVHSLLGENGAGKSTLIKVLGGIYIPDEGKIFIEGEEVNIDSVETSQNYGISIIHQELVLVPHMSVAENIFLGREPMKNGMVDFNKMYKDSRKILQDLNIDISPRATVESLTIANQQMVEIAKAISVDAKILIMDEPTSSISDKEVETLFEIINQLKDRGVGIIYISHKMDELEQICDRITVLRDGKYIKTLIKNETNRNEMVSLMVGRDLDKHYHREYRATDEKVLEVNNLTGSNLLENITFHLNKGEILGFAGLIGAGRTELMETIFGLREYEEGEILINNQTVQINTPEDAINNKIALVPESRKDNALFAIQNVRYNTTINILDEFMTKFKVDKKIESSITEEYIKSLSIKTPSQDYTIDKLSGGNQQKVIIGRWLATQPNILILDEPTRGIDVGSKAEIYAIMDRLIGYGVSIIMVSSELPEIINISDRTYIMSEGKITGELDKNEMTQDLIMNYATMNI